jgi:hypothetical protein
VEALRAIVSNGGMVILATVMYSNRGLTCNAPKCRTLIVIWCFRLETSVTSIYSGQQNGNPCLDWCPDCGKHEDIAKSFAIEKNNCDAQVFWHRESAGHHMGIGCRSATSIDRIQAIRGARILARAYSTRSSASSISALSGVQNAGQLINRK